MNDNRRPTRTIRVGPISIFSLVIALCVAVLCVLTISTAYANQALAKRQGAYLQGEYTNEVAGQLVLAQIDDTLARTGATNQQTAFTALDAALPTICHDVENAVIQTNGDATTTVTATRDNATITIICSSSVGRQLTIQLGITTSATVEVRSWRTSTPWIEPEQPPLLTMS